MTEWQEEDGKGALVQWVRQAGKLIEENGKLRKTYIHILIKKTEKILKESTKLLKIGQSHQC